VRKQRGRGECCAHCNEEVETIILVDRCKFIEKDDLDKILPSSGSMIVETTRHDKEKRHKFFLLWPTFDWNFNLQMGKSFNFI